MGKIIGVMCASHFNPGTGKIILECCCAAIPTGIETFTGFSFISQIEAGNTLSTSQLNSAIDAAIKNDYNTTTGLTINSADIAISKLS